MPKFLNLVSQSGKQEYVDIKDFNKNPNAYGKYKIRMVDDSSGKNYDIPATMFGQAQQDGLRPWNMEKTATAKPQPTTSQPSSRNVAPTPSYQDMISGDYWSKQLGAKPKQDILPTQNKVGLDLPNFGKQDEYVNRTAGVLYNEQQKFTKSEEEAKRIQAQLAEANKRAEALKKQIAQERTTSYTPYGMQVGQINADSAAAKKLEQEQNVIAKLSAQLNENEYFKKNLQRLEGVASDLESQASKEILTQEQNQSWLSALTAGRDVMRGTYGIQHNEKMNQASAIRENVRETRRLLREASLNNDSFYNKLGRGLRDAFLDINTWDMGVNSVRNSATTLLAKNNLDKGKDTVSDNAVLESAALKNVTSQKTRDAISAWYNAGITTTNMIPFMAYIYSSPFNNVGKGLSSSITKAITQRVEGTLLQRMLPQVVYRASVNGMKGIGRFAGDVLGGSATALTFANQNILSDTLNRYQGQHTGQFTPDGRFEYTGSQNAKGIGRSFAEAFATQAIEYQSELVGEYFTPLTRLLGKGFGKAIGYGSKEMFDAAGNKITSRFFGLPGHKISLDKTVDLFSRLTNKECWGAWNKFMKATKQNGVIGEYLEEVVGNMENATLGINNANWGTGEGGVFNPKENMETFLAVAVGTGFMSGLGGVSGAIRKGEISRAYNRANADGIKAFNLEAWQSIRDQIDNCPVPELPTIVVNLMDGMNDNQKRVIQNYAAFSVAKQGSLMADFKEQLEKPHIARVGTSVEISADGTEKYFIMSMDEQNGLLSTKEFRSEEDANAYKARVEEYINNGRNVQVLNQLLSTDEGLKSAEQIAADMGEPISYIPELFYLDPLKRTDTEQAIVDEFVSRANNVAFPPTDVNENHEVQNGQDIAEGTEIGDQQAIDTINQREANAISAWNEIDDPDLKNFVTTLTENGSTPNQIVEWLRYYEYPEDVIAAFCELCNAKAEKEGYLNRTGQKIEEQVAQQVKQNTFAGTFNGEGTPIILQVQDENGTPLYVVGGNISADEQGMLSSDGLVVLRDEQGNFIQRPNMQGLTLAGTYSVEDYTNSLLTQTQEAVTAQIQSTESQEQPIEEQPVEEQKPETQQQQEQKPAIPVDKDGKKLYTQVPVEDTIADITSELGGDMDSVQSVVRTSAENANARLKAAQEKKKKGIKGKDPQEMIANANKLNQEIADAQAEADYWNNALNQIAPQQQAVEEPVSQEPSATQEQPTEEQPQPIDETTVPVGQRVANMYGKLEDEEVRENLDTKISELNKQLSKLPKKPKMVADENVYLQEKEKLNAQRQELQKKLDYWTSVKNHIQQQTKTTPEDIKAAQDELTGTNARLEYAAQTEQGATTPMEIAGEFIKNAKIIPSDFYAETGMQAADARKQFPGMLSNNGVTIASLAEQLVQHDNDNYGGRFFKGDDMEARNYIIQALTGAESRKALGRNMTAEEEEYVRLREQQREDFHQEAYGMSYSDYLAFEEQQMPFIWRLISNFAPEQYDQMVAEYYESLPEDYFTQQNNKENGTEQQNPTVAGSNEILHQPPTNNETGGGQRQDPAAEEGDGNTGDNQNDEVSGGTQGIAPIGSGFFGPIFNQFKGKVREAFAVLLKLKSGDVLGVFHRDDIGDIDLVWGSAEKNMGLEHIINKHVGKGKDFETIDDAINIIDNVIQNGTIIKDGELRYVVSENGYRVAIRKDINGEKKNWIVTAVDYNRTKEEKGVDTNPTSASHGVNESEPAAPNNSISGDKDTTKSPNSQENQQKNDEKSDEGQKDDVNVEIKKDIEAFIAESAHDVQITNYDEENYEAQISVDGKPSNIVVTPPMEMEEGMHAEYRPENSSYQELGDLLDEYNETVDRKDQGLAGEHLAAIFSSVDAAINFEKWMEQKKAEQSNLPTHSQFVLYKNNAAGNYATVSGNPQSGYVVRYFADKTDISEDLQSGLSIGESMLTPEEFSEKLNSGELKRSAIFIRREEEQKQEPQKTEKENPEEQTPKEKSWDEMTEKEKMDYAFSQPLLTEEEIKNAPTDEVNKANALAFIKGQKGKINSLSYYLVYKDVKLSTGSSSADNAADDTAQLDETNSGSSRERRAERKHSGLRNRRVDTEGGGQQDPNQDGQQLQRGENGEGRPSDDAGEAGDMEVPGDQQPVGRHNPGDSQPGRGSVSDGDGHNVSQQGGKGRSRKNPNTDRRGSDKTDRGGAERNSELDSQDIDNQLQREIDKFKNLLSDYREIKNKKSGNIYSSALPGISINPEKIEAWGRLIYQGAKVGYLILRKGHTTMSEWMRIMKDMLTPAMHEIEVPDVEIDEFIKEMWHCNLPIGDEIHTIAEWSKIMQEEKLRQAIRATLEEKKKQQIEAEPIEVKIADKNNIAETLPYLLPLQQDDVYRAEMQFFDENHNDYEHANGKGYMFTNGTGTGKTYTGLGIAKRFIKQGKKRILVLTPSSTKVKDWVLDAANLNIEAYNLEEWAKEHGANATASKGEGLVVTTYANFRQNQALLEDEFDLVIYDESHRLLENKKGGETEGSKQHYMLTNKDENWAFNRLQLVNPVYRAIQDARREFDEQYKKEKEQFQDAQEARVMLPDLLSPITEFAGYPKLKAIKQKYDELTKKFYNEVKPQLEAQAKESVKKTKVVFLSATPFNTRENLGYAEGYIFRYPQTGGRIGPRSQFYLTNFGAAYRWRNNRLESRTTNPEAVTRQEIAFSDYLQNQLGTMSGRVIDSEFDYSRDFPTVTFEKAEELNNAFEEIKKMEGNIMRKAFYEVMYNYQYTSVLFEAMKTSCIIPRIRQHLDAGRKIVLFHRRMETASPITPPFREMLNKANVLVQLLTSEKDKNEAKAQIADFEQRFANMLEWEQTIDLRVPRAQILEAFGEEQVLLFSGKETTKQKNAAVDEFNNDASKKKIIVIQEASGKEGISLHDKTGKNQRVLISLAMPQSPITALQVEGRIYRIGNKSNAIFEYPLLGLDEELVTWGQRFNSQVGTTENLALGSKARNLRESFAKAVIEHSGDVPLETQGIGGKEMDEAISQDQTDPFDKAVLDFYGNAKTSGRRDNREGTDYYPTPEPLGFMMVEWANLSEGESVLEPSAGHGAIARYVPSSNQLTSVEPSTTLFGRLQVLAGGIGRKFENDIFENYNIVNKHDVVLMNPPFGTAGRLAIDHVAKAYKHLSEGGRIVAIIPRGSADAKFDKWIETEKTAAVVGEIQLPNITFQNAGTQVACRVVIIDKISNEQMRNEALNNAKQIELPNNYAKIEDFFEDLRGITMPARTIDQKTKSDKKIMPIIKELKDEDNNMVVQFTPTGVLLSGVGLDYLNMKGKDLKLHVAAQYARANKQLQYIPARMTRMIAAYEAIKKMALKLADMSEEEMNDFVAKNIKDGAPKKSIAEQFKYEVKKNTRTGEDMHVVSKNSGVVLTEDEYNSARSSAKANGGYWSRYAGGFVFPSEVAAKTFLGGGYINSDENETAQNNNFGTKYSEDNTINDTAERFDIKKGYNAEQLKVLPRDSYTNRNGSYIVGLDEYIERLRNEKKALSNKIGSDLDSNGNPRSDINSNSMDNRRRESVQAEINRIDNLLSEAEAENKKRLNNAYKFREKYGIDSSGRISTENLSKMLRDFTDNKADIELFDKIVEKLNPLGIDIRFNYGLANKRGYAEIFENKVVFNTDAFTRDMPNEEKATVITHELLHQLLQSTIQAYNFKMSRPALSRAQKEAVKELKSIYSSVKKAMPEDENGIPFYGTVSMHEMISELANPKFREALSGIQYDNRSILQKIIDCIKKMLGLPVNENNNNALEGAQAALQSLIENYNQNLDLGWRRFWSPWLRLANKIDYALSSEIDDKALLDKLNSEPTIKVYRAMQVIDGKLYPPMAAKVGGSLVEPTKIGTWYQADEHPELIIQDGTYKDGTPKYKFKLDKGGNDATGKKATDVAAAYNPYWHTSRSPINDQFKSAWIRPNLVTVEVEVPESELTSGYKAQYAKDSVGEVDWKSGSVSGQLAKLGNPRKVILSRYNRVVRVVPVDEVADKFKEMLDGTGIEVPENTITPQLRAALEAKGVKIGAPEKGVIKNAQIEEALSNGLETDNSIRYRKIEYNPSIIETSNEKIQKIFKEIDKFGINDITLQHINELYNEIEDGKAIFNRYKQPEIQGLREAGRAAFGASCIASYVARSQGTGRYGSIVGAATKKEQLSKIKEYAQKEDLWFDDIKSELQKNFGEPFASGMEADVYRESEKTVVKHKDGFYSSPLEAIDAIVLHNTLFPETAMEIIGFGESNGNIQLVVRQLHINIEREATQEEIDSFAESRGLTKKGEHYVNEEVDASDFHYGNIVIDAATDKPVCIDCLITFNSKVQAQGGRMPGSLSNERPTTQAVSQKQQEIMRAKAESLAKSLNVPIKIITLDEAPTHAKGSKGYYNPETGEVVIVLDNNRSTLDIEQTVAHEVIGHHGLRGLLGRENYYKLMNAVYDNLPQEDKDAINEAARRNGWQLYTAMDEYFADQAEKMAWDARSATLWQNIVHYLTEALRNLGFIFKPNYKDARYWLWLSKNNLKRSDVMSNIRRNALLAKLDKLSRPEPTVKKDDVLGEPQYLHRDGNYVDSAAYDAIEENLRKKTFYWKEAFIDYMQAYQVFQEEMAKGLKNGLMDNQNALLGDNALTSAIEQRRSDFLRLQLRPLQDLIKSLQDEFGSGQEGIRNIENYLMMKHGLERNRVLFMRDWYNKESERKIKSSTELSPEAEYIYEKMERAIWQDFDDGNIDEKERDKQLLIALNDAYQQYLSDTMSQFNRIKNNELENYELGIQSLAEAYQNIDDFINQHATFDPNKHDMSGLTALKEYFSGSKYEDDKIIAEVESLDQKIGFDTAQELMDAVQNVSQFALDQDYKNGLVTKEGYNRAKNMFRYYVPLRGFDDTTMEDVYGYMTYSKGTGSKSLVHANGRFSKAGSPLATASNMALNAIARGLRNQNKQRAYRLVNTWLKDNPEAKAPAIVADLWVGLDNNGNDIVHTPNITDDMSAEEIRDEIDRFNEEMKFLESQGKASKVKSEASFRHRFSSDNHKYEHIVPLMINGKAKMIVFNGNPRPAQALRGDLQPTVNKEFGMDRIMGQFNRIMAGAFTSYNPTFMMTNLLRDTGFANYNIAVKEGMGYYAKFTKNQSALLTKNLVSYAKLKWNYDKGIAPRNKMEQYFYEFMRNGGKTGFVNQQDIAKLEKMLGAYNKQLSTPGRVIKVINALPQAIKAANERIENINRFAAYVTSRETGRSVMRSIYDAKEVSVNFNRKGAAGNTANIPNATFNMKLAANLASFAKNSYLFFNTGVQSLNLLSKNFRDHTAKAAVYTVAIPILLGGILLPLLNQIFAESFGDGDDDPYANLPEWTRRNNFCFYLGGGRFLRIPLPIELRAFYGLGDIAAGYLVNSNLKSEKNIALDMASQLSQILPVDYLGEGGSLWGAISPDGLKPLVQIATNTDWTGKPIYKDYEWNKYDPEYKKAYKGELEPFVNLSKWINEVSGGSDHVKGSFDGPWNNPSIWRAVIQGYGGGAVMDAVRLVNLVKRVVTWDFKDFSTKEVPIIKAIFDTPTEKTQYYRMLNKFYNYREEYDQFAHDINEWRKSDDPLEHSRFLYHTNPNNPSAEYRRYDIMRNYERTERYIKKISQNPKLSEAEKEAWDEQLTKLKVDAVKLLDQIE